MEIEANINERFTFMVQDIFGTAAFVTVFETLKEEFTPVLLGNKLPNRNVMINFIEKG